VGGNPFAAPVVDYPSRITHYPVAFARLQTPARIKPAALARNAVKALVERAAGLLRWASPPRFEGRAEPFGAQTLRVELVGELPPRTATLAVPPRPELNRSGVAGRSPGYELRNGFLA
jgi:hypothetical protein